MTRRHRQTVRVTQSTTDLTGSFVRKAVTILAGTGLAACGIVLGAAPASAAPAATAGIYCSPYETHYTSGAKATWRECFDGGKVRVNGFVTDTDSDGQCAQVYASYNNYTGRDYSSYACPEGEQESFTFPWRSGSNAYVYLREVTV